MANCAQINNTTIIGTSAIGYDSTPLPCSDVQSCDGLNDILTSFNNIICNIQTNTSTLINNVTNITEDVMLITEDIININNQLGICCSTTTTTSTTICNNPNLVFNGTFTRSLIGWTLNIFPDWVWSNAYGGSAHYVGRDEHAILSQNVLTPGVTYDISFDLWCDNPNNVVKVLLGTTQYAIPGISGYVHVNLVLPCVGTSLFGIQGYDESGAPFDTIYIKNVNVSVHCPQFTTTTTTTRII